MKERFSNKILTMILVLVLALSFLPLTFLDAVAESVDDPSATEDADIDGEDDVIIDDEEVPLALARHNRGWSLMNLIFSISGGVLALIMGVHTLLRMRYRYESEPIERGRLLLMLAVPMQAIIGIILFLTTQDGSSFMLLVDGLTIVHAVLFLIGALCYFLVYRIERDEDGGDKFANGRA